MKKNKFSQLNDLYEPLLLKYNEKMTENEKYNNEII
jgi:hypothetical protein